MEVAHVQDEPVIGAGEFRQRCLALLDRVAESGVPLVVTKRGRPVARIVPIEHREAPLKGSVRVLTDDDEALFSTGEG